MSRADHVTERRSSRDYGPMMAGRQKGDLRIDGKQMELHVMRLLEVNLETVKNILPIFLSFLTTLPLGSQLAYPV